MREILHELDEWRARGDAIALARVVDLDGSGPRLPGAAMAVNARGEVIGSVSGGCVEGAVVTEALAMLNGDDGEEAADGGAAVIPAATGRLVSFGYSDEDAFAVGLTCGGTIHLFLEPLTDDRWPPSVYQAFVGALDAAEPVALATVVEGPQTGAKFVLLLRHADVIGSLGDPDLDRVVVRDARGQLAQGVTAVRHYGAEGQARESTVSVFVESFAPAPRLVIFGAVDFTAALARMAKLLGFHVTVCDAREVFATAKRFPMADEVVVDWPNRLLDRIGSGLGPRDAICVLTHDAKFDVPAIVAALQTEVGYIGAMGSRRTHEQRRARLHDEGLGDEDLARVMAPIGLDIGARTPEETAVSICAEIIALRTGHAEPRSLRDRSGPIH